ncbi:MAG: LamG domain-containing protein [Tildeniella nuda ZEHNDER 1965/U140]|jgi:hypothetical protein|nr:LamG domain-containing protein [Tildeniella nuda ZEHNDER 1965/U140]
MVNATAVKTRILVGPDEILFDEAFVTLAAGFDKRDRGGLAKISGTLVLTALDNNVALLNPRLNYDIGGGIIPRALWSRGQFFRVQVLNSSGAWIDHRFSELFILKEPLPPKSPQPQDARITLEVGCWLKLKDYAAPNPNPLLACDPEDPTLSNVGIVQSPGEVVRKLLVKAGVQGTWEGSIENYPFYYPVSNDSGSYLAVAGEVAYARFYSLVQKRSPAGNLTAVDYRADVNATPLLTVTIGEDEAEYMPVAGQETPCEEIRVQGSTYDITDTWQDTTVCKITYAPGSNLVTRITCTRDAQDATQILHEVEELEPRGLLAPDDSPGDDSLIFSRRTTNIKTYEVNVCGNGKLLQDETTIVRPFRVAASEFWSGLSTAQKANYAAFSPSIDTRTITYYHYTPKEVVDEIESRTSRMLASVLPDVNPLTAGVIFQVPAASEIQTYREIRPGQWEYTQAPAAPLIDVFPDAVPDTATVSEKIRLTTTNPISTVSGSGQNNPPAAERRPQRYGRNERQLDGVALFGSFAGSNQQDRRRFISIPWMISNEQASAIAQEIGEDLVGRRQGAQILLGLTDEWLTNENPYPVIHVREPRFVFSSGVWSKVYDTIVYQVDGLSFSHDRTRATVGCELIWLATIPANATVPVLPYVPTVMRSGVAPVLQLSSISGSFGSLISRSGVAPIIRLFAPSGKAATTITRSGVAPVLRLSALSGSGVGVIGGSSLATGAIGAWKLDNSLNDAISTNNWICRYFDQNAGSLQTATPTYVTGYNGQAFTSSDTAGSGVYGSFLQISIATGTALRIDDKSFTQAFVFRPQSSSYTYIPLCYYNTSSGATQMQVVFNGTKITFQYASTTGNGDVALFDSAQDVGLETSESYSINKTYLVVIWNNPTGTAGLAVRNLTDSVNFTTVTATGKPLIVRTGGSNRFLLNQPNSGFFAGTWIDCVTMWNRVLSSAEITSLVSNPQYPFDALPVVRSGVAPVLRLSALSGSRNASVARSGVAPVLRLNATPATLAASVPSAGSPSAYWNLTSNGNAVVGTPNLDAGAGATFTSGDYVTLSGGSNSTLTGADTADISVGNAAFTWCTWAYLNSTTAYFILQKGFVPGTNYSNAIFEYVLYFDGSRFVYVLYNIATGAPTSQTVLASNFSGATSSTFYFLTIYYKPGSPNEIGISVNAGAFNKATTTIQHGDTAQNLTLGYRSEDGANLWGRMRYTGFFKDLPTSEGGNVDLSYYYNSGAGRAL